ncbi:MAG: alpha-D-ribose 1-methylphosphonate 5-triphosphate diphosphatase, partial [Desulfobacteraceae bacterium]
PMASHDDTLPEHCREAIDSGIRISEFPTTLAAAQTARELGMRIIMGAPNMVRGESHSGNISARELAERRLLDGFSSDYVPMSLLHAAFELHHCLGLNLYSALSTVTTNIAEMLHLNDRGTLQEGKRADLIRVQIVEGNLPVVKSVWKNGNLVVADHH